MANGAFSKKIVTDKILSTFEGSFIYNDGKEIRIPVIENGERVEIKITLTCAKTNVGGADACPTSPSSEEVSDTEQPIAAPTEEEKKKVSNLLATLGL